MSKHENITYPGFTYWEYRGFLIGRVYSQHDDLVTYEVVRPFHGKNIPTELKDFSREYLSIDYDNVVYGVHQSVLDYITKWSEDNWTINEESPALKPLDDVERYSKYKEAMNAK